MTQRPGRVFVPRRTVLRLSGRRTSGRPQGISGVSSPPAPTACVADHTAIESRDIRVASSGVVRGERCISLEVDGEGHQEPSDIPEECVMNMILILILLLLLFGGGGFYMGGPAVGGGLGGLILIVLIVVLLTGRR
jgi:hypothetical protein